MPIAADLLAGNQDPRASVVKLIHRAHASLPAGIAQVALRMDTGYFAADAAIAAQELNMVFAIGVKRNASVWRATATVPDDAYVPVIGMDNTEVALVPYAPNGWPTGLSCLARRTRIRADQVSTDPRARKRRTIPKTQLALALDGDVEYVYRYSFILTNQSVTGPDGTLDPELIAEVEHWYRHRTDIEALNKDSKHSAALRHMPSADPDINRVWMWAALLACALSAWLQEITGIDRGNGRGRATITRLRRELINIPARVIHPGRTTVLRLPPGPHLLTTVLTRLQALPSG